MEVPLQKVEKIKTQQTKNKPSLAGLNLHNQSLNDLRNKLVGQKLKIEQKKSNLKTAYAENIKNVIAAGNAELLSVLNNGQNSEFFSSNDITQGSILQFDNKKTFADLHFRSLQRLRACSSLLFKKDKALLKHLTDIKVRTEAKSQNFEISFTFLPNSYFQTAEIKVTVEFGNGRKLQRITSSEIQWKSEEYQKKHMGPQAQSIFRIFTPKTRRSRGMYGIRSTGACLIAIKKVLMKYFGAAFFVERIPAIDAINASALGFVGWDSTLDGTARRMEQARKEEQNRGRQQTNFRLYEQKRVRWIRWRFWWRIWKRRF